MVRVLWLGQNLAYPPKSGALQRNYNLLREVAKRCDVHVLAFDHPITRLGGLNPQSCVRALEKFCTKVEWVPLEEGGVRGNRYCLALRGLVSKDPFVMHWLRSRQMEDKLQKVLESIAFDVVHFDTLGLAQYLPLLRGSGTVLNHHDIESSMIARRASNDPNMLRRRYWYMEARKLMVAEGHWCPQFNVNLVVSEEEEQLLRASAPGIQTAVVANGVDTDYFTPRPDPGGRTLLFCGTLDMYSNSEAMKFFFSEIWPRLTQRLEDMTVYVVGARPPKWLRRLGATDDRIRVPGFVEDVRPYFRQAVAYVCPIRDGGGTRLKILDALAMGMPTIATTFACSGLSLKDGKHVLLAETPEDFVDRIEQTLSSMALRLRLGAAGRDLVEQTYSWTAVGQSLIEAYQHAFELQCAVNVA